MPENFVGLSYETRQLMNPAFFSSRNVGLIRAFKDLAPHGVLRFGGNTSEFAWWKPIADTPEPAHPQTREVAGEPRAQYYPVTPDAVRDLVEFLEETGWSCIYGINLGTNTPERAADEATFVAKALGSRLEYFQIGNEVDLFDRHLRDPQTWSAKAYLKEWLAIARAIVARVPGARFGVPDVAGDISWLGQIASQWREIENPPLVTMTHHYYFGGPATNPAVNIANLLDPDTMKKVQGTAQTATAAAAQIDTRVRMTEGNTCYRGGKPGVSDVFAAALWSADYALLLASNNYAGVNLHGGTGPSVAISVGGVLPGDELLKSQGATPEQIASHPHPFYTPIGTFGDEYVLEPVSYGLKFANALRGGVFFKTNLSAKLQSSDINATAYAAKFADGKTAVIVLNKDAQHDLTLQVDFGTETASVVDGAVLHAPAIDSRQAAIDTLPSLPKLNNGKLLLTVPRASGLRIEVAPTPPATEPAT